MGAAMTKGLYLALPLKLWQGKNLRQVEPKLKSPLV